MRHLTTLAIVATLAALVYGASLIQAIGSAIAAILIVGLVWWSLQPAVDPEYDHDEDCECVDCRVREVRG